MAWRQANWPQLRPFGAKSDIFNRQRCKALVALLSVWNLLLTGVWDSGDENFYFSFVKIFWNRGIFYVVEKVVTIKLGPRLTSYRSSI